MDLSFSPPRDGPLTFHHLPLELKLEVIELLYGSYGASVTPIMTPDAAWVNPYYHLGVIEGNRLALQERTEKEISVTSAKDVEQPPLKSLRLVSREYNAICTPLLYRQLDLDVLRTGATTASEIHETIATYGKYVRRIRIYITRYVRGPWGDNVNTLAEIVAECRLATAIAIYYNNGNEPELGSLAMEVVRMVGSAQVTQIGIYSARILPAKGGRSISASPSASKSAMQLLKALLLSPQACPAILRLDIVLEDLSTECFELLRRNLQSLKSLTVRRAFRHDRLSEIWNPGETYWWARSVNLTRLVLIGCSRPGAKHLVGLVACFPALRRLVWAGCGAIEEPILPPPDADWNSNFKNLPSRPRNLEMFHIEYALEWELCWLGLISSETVMVLHFNENRLANALDKGVEMFLGMKKLRVLPPSNPEFLEPGIRGSAELPQPNGRNLDDVCAKRGVALSRDGRLLEGLSVAHVRPRRSPVVLELSPSGELVPTAAGTEVITFSGGPSHRRVPALPSASNQIP